MEWITVYAPATIGNIGPGFDVLGLAVRHIGDTVKARRIAAGVVLTSVERARSTDALSTDADKNTASLAAREALRMLGEPGGIELELKKGIPCGSGLGSSAASAAAGAYAANALYGEELSDDELILAATRAEAAVSGGYFADNTAPAILGGATVTRSGEQLDVTKIGTVSALTIVLVTPHLVVLTRAAREILPRQIPMEGFVANMANACLITAAFAKDDYGLFSRCLSDVVIQPHRAKLIPGFDRVTRGALDAGADGVAISGSGPTMFAVTDSARTARAIETAMVGAFAAEGVESTSLVTEIDFKGTREI